MSVIEDLGLDPETVHWKDLAACRNSVKALLVQDGVVLDVFEPEEDMVLEPGQTRKIFNPMFDDYEDDVEPYPIRTAVDEMCRNCPVREVCYETGVSNSEPGVWGGWYLHNGEISESKNSHKDSSWEDLA